MATDGAGTPAAVLKMSNAFPSGLPWSKDFTVALEKDVGLQLISSLAGTKVGDKQKSADGVAAIEIDEVAEIQARVNACFCNSGQSVSVTGRILGKYDGAQTKLAKKTYTRLVKKAKPASWNWTPDEGYGDHQIATCDIVRVLRESLGNPGGQWSKLDGVFVVAGSTNSAKSSIAQTIALDYLAERKSEVRPEPAQPPLASPRFPHLITFEDPIEKWNVYTYLKKERKYLGLPLQPDSAWKHGISFTPRKLDADVISLEGAFRDAKRQTPACFYVGEVRGAEDWRHIMEFAGSGHFVIATTHAGSLVETIGRILEGTDATTPAARGWSARRIIGVLHLQRHGDVVFPSIWNSRGSGQLATHELVADGLGSVIANDGYCLSRRQFLDRMIVVAEENKATKSVKKMRKIQDDATQVDLMEF